MQQRTSRFRHAPGARQRRHGEVPGALLLGPGAEPLLPPGAHALRPRAHALRPAVFRCIVAVLHVLLIRCGLCGERGTSRNSGNLSIKKS